MKTCARCKQTKPHSEYYAYSRSKDGLQSYCKSCSKSSNSKFRERNPNYYETYNETVNRSVTVSNSLAEKRHAQQQYDFPYQKIEVVDLVEYWKQRGWKAHICNGCGLTLKEGECVGIDHIKPLIKGGAHSVDNLQPLCKACNQSKHTEDWTAKYEQTEDE